jgi:farnesyl-diphosphate farnesyltransferase
MSAASPFQPDLLTDLLRAVSRSFYLTLRVLPAAIRPQIGVAYLLARATDTIADTAIVPVPERLEVLEVLRARILGRSQEPLEVNRFLATEGDLGGASHPAERALLARVEEALAVVAAFEERDRDCVRAVLDTITSGQILDLQRFGRASVDQIVALATDAELDDYIYRVAGCVGLFWTQMCRAHLFLRDRLDDQLLTGHGVRFGKGLQLVNILRDLPGDLRLGRCYLPADGLRRHGLSPAALLDPTAIGRFRNLYDVHLGQARQHLAAGWAYTNALPRRAVRVRLACAWPILIGVRTLAKLRTGNALDAERRIKISRREVRRVMTQTLLSYPFPGAWERLFERARLG